ncbi:hypothetical protein AJ87_03330 [Rhizobium yanglingense]|nr:hypothetical protein AJ87_03330 [Rhizobium yanglingense]
MRIERVAVFAFPRHNDDQAAFCNPAQFRNRLPVVENMLDHMRADDRVEIRVCKGEVFDLGRDIFDARQP